MPNVARRPLRGIVQWIVLSSTHSGTTYALAWIVLRGVASIPWHVQIRGPCGSNRARRATKHAEAPRRRSSSQAKAQAERAPD